MEFYELIPEPVRAAVFVAAKGFAGAMFEMAAQGAAKAWILSLRGGDEADVQRAFEEAILITLRDHRTFQEIGFVRWLGRSHARDAFLAVLSEPVLDPDPLAVERLLEDTIYDPATFPRALPLLIPALWKNFLAVLYRSANPRLRDIYLAVKQDELAVKQDEGHRRIIDMQAAMRAELKEIGSTILERTDAIGRKQDEQAVWEQHGFELRGGARRNFDLEYAQLAVEDAASKYPREGEVDRLLEAARGPAPGLPGSAGRVLLVGPSGSGKSVLMSQAFARVRNRALFLSMHSPPDEEYEVPAAERAPAAAWDEGPGDGRGLGGPEPAPRSVAPPAPGRLALGGRSESVAAATIAVPVRMHWLAGACALAGRPQPGGVLSAAAASRRVAELLGTVASPADPVYIFIDAVDQAGAAEALFSGLLPLRRLPPGVVVIVSTWEKDDVITRLRGLGDWKPVNAARLSTDETVNVMRNGWSEEEMEFPALDADLQALLDEKTVGLPFLARHWGERLREVVLDAGSEAKGLRQFRRELEQTAVGTIPRDYLARLMVEARRDFVPPALPEALVWCLSIVETAVTREQLHAAQPVLRAEFPDLPEVARAQIDGALARLSGFLQRERVGGAHRWRLAHPRLGEVWRQEYGTRDRIARLNAGLLPFGATPEVELWSERACEEWIALAADRGARYERLTREQRDRLLRDLLRRLTSTSSLTHLAHRFLALRRQQAILMIDRGDTAAANAVVREVYDQLRARTRENNARELQADLVFDLAGAAGLLAWLQWHDGKPEHAAMYDEAMSLFQEAARLAPERWSPIRAARLLRAMTNVALVRGAADDGEPEALAVVDEALALGSTLDTRAEEVRVELAECHALRASYLARLGRRDESLASYDAAVEAFGTVAELAADRREAFGKAHLNRAFERLAAGRVQEAAADYDASIALLTELDQAAPELRSLLAEAYAAHADCAVKLGRGSAAAKDYGEAITLLDTLEPDAERRRLTGTVWQRLAGTLRDEEEFARAEEAYTRAIELLGTPDPRAGAGRQALLECYRERAALQHGTRGRAAVLDGYRGAPETVLLANGEVGLLLHTTPPEDSAREPLRRLIDQTPFLSFAPLPDEYRGWACERLGLADPEFAEHRDRLAFRIASLAFHHDAHLLAVEDTARRGNREVFALCRLGGELLAMDWTNHAIYAANERWGIRLETPGRVMEYVRFFFRFVYGVHGRFVVFDDPAELPWTDGATEADVERVRAASSPLAVVPSTDPGTHQLNAWMTFRDSLFFSAVHVADGSANRSRGEIWLTDEALLLEDLPVHDPPLPLLRDAPPAPALPEAGEAEPVDYDRATEVELLRHARFGHLLRSAPAEDPEREPSRRVSDEAGFLSFEPLPEERLDWARERVGLADPEFAEYRERVAFRVAPLPFHDGVYLLAAEDTSRRALREMFALCRLGGEVLGMDWTNHAIYEANRRWGIRLDTPAQVEAYVRFFFQFVFGRHGRFLVFGQVDELTWLNGATQADVDRVRGVSAPPATVPSTVPGTHQMVAYIAFRDAIFSTTVRVVEGSAAPGRRGNVSLEDETLLLEDVPVHSPSLPLLRDTPPTPEMPVVREEEADAEAPVDYDQAPEMLLLRDARFGHLLRSTPPEDPEREPLRRVSDEAWFLSFEPLPNEHLEWARERVGLGDAEFEAYRERVAFRIAALPFYGDVHLLVAEDTSLRGHREMFALCRPGGEVLGMDWTHHAISTANERWGIRLDTPARVEAYVRFFFHFVLGDQGRFQLFGDVDELTWLDGATQADVDRVRAVSAPLAMVPSTVPETLRVVVYMAFDHSIFTAAVDVVDENAAPGRRGEVKLNGKLLLPNVPVQSLPLPLLRDVPRPPEAAAVREGGEGGEAPVDYDQAPEMLLLRHARFGNLLRSTPPEDSDQEPLSRVSDEARFLSFEPLPEEHLGWARARVGLGDPEFAAHRERVAFRIAALPFYDDVYLLAAEDTSRRGHREMFALCRPGGEAFGMDWTHHAISTANERWGIRLDTPARVEAYVRFFFHFVVGDQGRFQFFGNVDELSWLDEATQADVDRVRAVSGPLAMVPPPIPETLRMEARMAFNHVIFAATVDVAEGSTASRRRGQVSMDGKPLLGGVPVRNLSIPLLRDAPPSPETLAVRAMEEGAEPPVDYDEAPETVLLRDARFGHLLRSTPEEDPDQEPLRRESDQAWFLSFEPLPEEHLDWARERVGLGDAEFAAYRERVAFRIAPLAFYDDVYLLVAEDTSRRGHREMFALCRPGGEVLGMDWTHRAVSIANQRWGIRLDTPERVEAYLRFFFHFVIGEHGRFQLFGDVDELTWRDEATQADAERVRAVSAPLAVAPSAVPDTHEVVGRMAFNGAIFSAAIQVIDGSAAPERRGLVSLNGERLLEGVPVHDPPLPLLRDEPPSPATPAEG